MKINKIREEDLMTKSCEISIDRILYGVYGARGQVLLGPNVHTKKSQLKRMYFSVIKKVIFNEPATIVFWADGTKTVVKCGEDDIWDPEKGLAMAVTKKFFGNEGFYYDIFKKWIPEDKQMDTIVVDGRPLMNALASQGLGEVVDALQQFGSIVKKVEENK
jgi:hypothetical protein